MPEELRQWFWRELDTSECAPVKRFYLKLEVIEKSELSPFLRLLWMCRIIVADRRVVWEHISESFTDSFQKPVDMWNEQLAVKLLRVRLEDSVDEPAATTLRVELHKHLTAVVKPPPTQAHPRAEAKKQCRDSEDCPYLIVPATEGKEGLIVCNGTLEPFGELLRVSRKRMFFVDSVKVFCDLGRVIHDSPELSDIIGGEEQLLVLALIYERFVARTSHWKDLLLSCPTDFPTVPSYWSWNDLSGLYGLDVLDDVLAKQERLRQFHTEVTSVLPLIYDALEGCSGIEREEFMGHFTIENIMWARAVFDSRAFNLNVDGRVVLALVPCADMINHSNHPDVLIRRVEPCGGDFVMQVGAGLTREDVGRELGMSYGPLQNWELLQHYGFVLDDNEHDKLPFPFDVHEADGGECARTSAIATDASHTLDIDKEWDKRRASLVQKYSLHLAGSCWIGYSGIPPPALIALMRIHLAQAEEFASLERHGPFTRVSHCTELEIIAVIAETVRCIIELPTDPDGDVDHAEGCEGSVGSEALAEEVTDDIVTNTRNVTLCKVLRRGLERIGNRCLEWCSARAAAIETEKIKQAV